MMGIYEDHELEERMMILGEGDVRIETIGQTPIWEFMPSPLHQVVVDDVRRSIRPNPVGDGCECFHLADFYLRLSDGSLRRPDVAIFCSRPEILSRNALTVIPQAVIEILSPGGEFKDLQLGPFNYLANGVLDVVVVDPGSEVFTHFRRDGSRTGRRGETVRLEMGCELIA